jgi:uncharacterized iron-regulated membrane protein
MSETTPGEPPQEAPKKASPIRIILMLALGGPVLAVGGCALFLANVSFGDGGGRGNDNIAAVGGILFAAGCLAFVVGIIWVLARWIDRRFSKAAAKDATPPAPQP